MQQGLFLRLFGPGKPSAGEATSNIRAIYMNDEITNEEYAESRSFWDKIKDGMRLSVDSAEGEEEERPSRRRSVPLRMHSARPNRVSVWHSAENFETARQVADGLKQGHPQVVNLENTDEEMAARIIDFLNGVTYALEGYVEKVGHMVYFFTPSSTVIDVEETGARHKPFYTGN